MKKAILIVIFSILPSIAMAIDSGRGTVTSLTYSDGGNLFFTTTATKVNDGCAATSYVIASTNAQIKNYYAMLLSADASDKKVLIRVMGCISLGTVTYPRVTLLQVTD